MNLLVTGGCGFIGSNFIRYWIKNYPRDHIVNLDKLTYAGHLVSTKDFSDNKNYRFIKGDICDHKVVDRVMDGVDVVVHFAAETHVDRSVVDPAVFVRTNVLGTQVLLEAAVNNKIKRFHHVSTDEVFGALSLGVKDKFSEKTAYDPRSPYSASKSGSDHLVRSYYYTFGLPVTISNCSNNFGPFQDPEKFIPRMITNLLLGEKIPIYGDGKYVRDWLYVNDHCRAIDIIVKKGRIGEAYLIGGLTKDINHLEVAELVLKLLGKNKSNIKFVKDRPGHDRRYSVDWRKINKELGWQPEGNFEYWLKKTIKWYIANKWWWKPLKAKSEELYEKTNQK